MVRALVLAVATPLLEKNPQKSRGSRRMDVPLVLSMARLVVLMFAVALTGQITRAGGAGWPEATLAMTIVLAQSHLSSVGVGHGLPASGSEP